MLSTKVVRAKPASPSGAGSAMEVATRSRDGAVRAGSLGIRAASISSAISAPPCAWAWRENPAHEQSVLFWQVSVKSNGLPGLAVGAGGVVGDQLGEMLQQVQVAADAVLDQQPVAVVICRRQRVTRPRWRPSPRWH